MEEKIIESWLDFQYTNMVSDNGLTAVVSESDSGPLAKITIENDRKTQIFINNFSYLETPERMINTLNKFGFNLKYKKELDLVSFLKNNIEPKMYEMDEENYCFLVGDDYCEVIFSDHSNYEVLGAKYFKEKFHADGVKVDLDCVRETLIKEKVSVSDIIKALKELGWF